MSAADVETLKQAIQNRYSADPSDKAKQYVGQFFGGIRLGTKITAQVVGNHGTYTVSIHVDGTDLTSTCSCYIDKHGWCHHCGALAVTFLQAPEQFKELMQRPLEKVSELVHLPEYLRSVTLDDLIDALRKQGITQKAFAESIGMSSRHLSAIKASERRNRHFHELGATKLACVWVLERLGQKK